ncbi:hypothetical protein CVV43_03450 [Candidatus Saccharibacteria bacterium HGW-Saccharibacteria-1]|jgi:hypothetical protein|nr:MAG: hypothetical protein CVV43_03450 [Candidatus Saccharibacteria bacterium HGW-Saccharibacteria-1]
MSNKINEELTLERVIKARFGIDIDIRQTIVSRIPVGQTAEATLFLTTKKQLYLYVSGQSKLLLGDVRKIVTRMGLRADLYMPPKGRPHYFNEIAKKKFAEVFPGRTPLNDDDLSFYRTLVPYNPALISITEVKEGLIYRFDSDTNTNWRAAVKFAYRRIKTS